ncbi:hypothetical protein LG329_10055 [Virgibacillus necropolis]|uniref:hypothetical protein n=1 Tax=Virgibacillus necropolis TaxID=163877 RepID=UPI00384ACD97
MKVEVRSFNDSSIKRLLSYAISEDRVNQEYDLYNQSHQRKLWSGVIEVLDYDNYVEQYPS